MYLSLRKGSNHKVRPLGDLPVRIGRAPDNDIILDSDSVSRHHAIIESGQFGVYLRDLASTNGIHVNGRKVREHELADGDRFALGDMLIVFHEDEPDEATRKVFVVPSTHRARYAAARPFLLGGLLALICATIAGAIDAWLVASDHSLKVAINRAIAELLSSIALVFFLLIFQMAIYRRMYFLPTVVRVVFVLLLLHVESRFRAFYQVNLDWAFLRDYLEMFIVFAVAFYGSWFFKRMQGANKAATALHGLVAAGTFTAAVLIYGDIVNRNDNGIDLGLFAGYPVRKLRATDAARLDERLSGIESQTANEARELIKKLEDRGEQPFRPYPPDKKPHDGEHRLKVP